MFKSLKYKRYDPKTEQYLYDLEDSEFGIVEVTFGAGVGVAVAREYSKRYKNAAEHSYAKASNADRQGLYAYVGKSLAVYTMWYYETYGYTIEDICRWQDQCCPKYIPNWKALAKSRDNYLAKFILIE